MTMLVADMILARRHAPRPVGEGAAHRPGAPVSADFSFRATHEVRSRIPPTGNGDDGGGWQDWPPDESAAK